MISKNRKLSETSIDITDTRYKINDNNPVVALKLIYRKILLRKKLLTSIEKAQIGDNPQVCILYNIIETRLFLNYLQRIVVEETFHHAIIIGEN